MDLSRFGAYHIYEEEIKGKTELISFLKHILMKEIVTSFQPAAISKACRNKSTATKFSLRMVPVFLLVLIAIIFSTSVSSAQSTEPVLTPITTDAYPHDLWKPVAEYTEVIVSEKAETIQILANPNLSQAEYATYTGYLKLLVYMKQDLANHLPLEDIASKSYEKVVQDTKSDAVLAQMPMDSFNNLYNELVVLLHQ